MWIKKLRQRKMQSAIIFLIIFICALLMTSAAVIMTSLSRPYNELAGECNSQDITAYLNIYDEHTINKAKENFERLSSVEKVLSLKRHYVVERLSHNSKDIEGFIDLVEYKEEAFNEIRNISGNTGRPGRGECLISSVMANENELYLGDKITLTSEAGKYEFEIAGIYAEPFSLSMSYTVNILIDEIPNKLNSEKMLYVYGSDMNTGDDIITDYYKAYDYMEVRCNTLKTTISNLYITEQIMGGILLAASIIVLLVSGVMIRYMIRNTVASDKKTIAIYKSIGYTNKTVLLMYLKLYLLLVLSGSIAGCMMSSVVSNGFMVNVYKNLGGVSQSSALLPSLVCIFVISIFVLLQVYMVLTKLKNIKPVSVFSGKEELGRKHKEYISTNFSPFGMALRMLFRDKKNTAFILLTCVMSIYCANFGAASFGMVDNMSDNNYYWIGFDEHDVSISAESEERLNSAAARLSKEEEVQKIIKNSHEASIMIPWQEGISNTVIPAMLYETYEDINMPVVEGRNPKYSDEIVVSNLLADALKKSVGDYMEVYITEDKKTDMLICGTYQSYFNMGMGVRILGDIYTENGLPTNYLEASLYLKENTDKTAFIEEYSDKYAEDLKLIDRKDKYKSIIDMICNPQKKALLPFIIFVMLLGGMNIMAVIYLKNIDSRKTNSIYKAIGYSAGHLIKANIWYVTIIAVLSMLITIPLFVKAFPYVMVMAMSMFGFKQYPALYNITYMAAVNISVLVIFGVSCVISSRSLYDNNVSELVIE